MIYILIFFIISFLFFFIKSLALCSFIMIFLAYYEAYSFLNKNLDGPKYLEEGVMNITPINNPIVTMLYHKYCNIIFNIIYNKISTGHYINRKYFNLTVIIQSIFLILIGIPKIFIRLCVLFWNLRKFRSFKSFIFSLCVQPYPPRRIVYINSRWVLNPNTWERLCSFIRINFSHLTESQQRDLMGVITKHHNIQKSLDRSVQLVMGKFNYIGSKYTGYHAVCLEASRDVRYVGLETSWKNASNKNFHNKEILINHYPTVSKKATLLLESVDNLNIKFTDRDMCILNRISGAYLNGFNSNFLSDAYKNCIDDYSSVYGDLKFSLSLIDIHDESSIRLVAVFIAEDFLPDIYPLRDM